MLPENQTQENKNTQNSDFGCIKNAYEVSNATYEKLIYNFDKNHILEFGFHDNSIDGAITFRLPEDVTPMQIEKIKFIEIGIPKTSWGDLEYHGDDINIELVQQSPFSSYASNCVACSINQVSFKGKKFFGINVDTYDGWGAHFKSKQAIWFNWFYNEERYYIQILYKQYGESWRSVSNGKMWWDLGKGIEVFLF